MNKILIIAWTLIQAGLFVMTGNLLIRLISPKETEVSLSKAYLFGYIGWFTLYEVIALPCIFLNVPTHVLGWILSGTGILLIGGGAYAMLKRQRKTGDMMRQPAVFFAEHGIFAVFPAAGTALMCLWQVLYSDTSIDAMYYVSLSSTAVYTDTLAHYSPNTGAKLTRFYSRYIFNCFPYYNAAVSGVSGINTVIQARTVMPVLSMLAAAAVVYQMGISLFREQGKRYADVFFLVYFVFFLCGSSIYLPGTFLLGRLFEGKALLCCIAVPAVLYMGIRLWADADDLLAAAGMFLSSGAAVCFAGSCVILLAGIPAVVLPTLIKQKSLKKCWIILAGIFPVLCWGGCYFLAQKGILPMKIRG